MQFIVSAQASCPSCGGQRAVGSVSKRQRSFVLHHWCICHARLNRATPSKCKAHCFNARCLRRPCGVPQRRAAGSVQAPASPVPPAVARFVTRTTQRSWVLLRGGVRPLALVRLATGKSQRSWVGMQVRVQPFALTLPSRGHAPAYGLRAPLMSNVRPHFRYVEP